MARVTITLKQEERKALSALAQRERRDPRQQAALILRCELARRGLLALDSQEGRRSGEAEGEEQRAERRREDVT